MNILNKLNGWQRIWLLGTVAVQIFMMLNWIVWRWPLRVSCLKYESDADYEKHGKLFKDCLEYMSQQEVLMNDLQHSGIALGLCLAAYAAAHLAVIIVRWVISGFKK